MNDKPDKKTKRAGVWDEIESFTELNTGLTVVITERVRGNPGYSYQLCQRDAHGGNKFIQYPVRGLDKVPVDGEVPATAADVIRALVLKAEEFISERLKSQSKKAKEPRRDKGKGGGVPKKERKAQGGLSALAKADAEAKGVPYKSKSQRRKDKHASGT